jgi:hypothetical protein
MAEVGSDVEVEGTRGGEGRSERAWRQSFITKMQHCCSDGSAIRLPVRAPPGGAPTLNHTHHVVYWYCPQPSPPRPSEGTYRLLQGSSTQRGN